jgi:hypothetical protein
MSSIRLLGSLCSLVSCLLLVMATTACSDAARPGKKDGELGGDWEWELANGCKETLSFSGGSFVWINRSAQSAGKIVEIKRYRNSEFRGIKLALSSHKRQVQPCEASGVLAKVLAGEMSFYLLDPSSTKMLICQHPNVVVCAGPFVRLPDSGTPSGHDHGHE